MPLQHFSMRSGGGGSFIGASLHDLNTVDAQEGGEMEGMSDIDREAVTEDSLENGDDSNSVSADCIHESYRNSLTLHGMAVEEERSVLDNNSRPSSPSYNILLSQDVLPIENVRARFLDLIVDHFINQHLIEVGDSHEIGYRAHEKANKRKLREARYEGDPRVALPLMYIANLYENLVNDVNARLGALNVTREATIGVALEAAGGLYRKLVSKFPKKGPISFRRRELATSHSTRNRFPELVVQEEKRVRFVVINGLDVVEKPTTMLMEDAEWFKRLTGRCEVAVTTRDYKYYSPRHKHRRSLSQPLLNIHESAAFSGSDSSPLVGSSSEYQPNNELQNDHLPESKQQQQQPQYHLVHHLQPQMPLHNQQYMTTQYPCTPVSPDSGANQHQPHGVSNLAPHLACVQLSSIAHLPGRLLHVPTSPAKFCDECGSPYLRETSKFCSECGTKRFGI
ncbi:PPR containing protein isoform X1 [Carex rostrata]